MPEDWIRQTVAFEWTQIEWVCESPPCDEDALNLPIAIPLVEVRYAPAEHAEIGFRTNAAFSVIGADAKLQFLDTQTIDLAIDPTLHFTWASGWGYVPLLAGLHLGDALEIVVSARIGYQLRIFDEAFRTYDQAFGEHQALYGGGVGVILYLDDALAMAPEAQYLRGTGEGEPEVLSITLAFLFGNERRGGTASPAASHPPPREHEPREERTTEPGDPLQPTTAPSVPPGYGP